MWTLLLAATLWNLPSGSFTWRPGPNQWPVGVNAGHLRPNNYLGGGNSHTHQQAVYLNLLSLQPLLDKALPIKCIVPSSTHQQAGTRISWTLVLSSRTPAVASGPASLTRHHTQENHSSIASGASQSLHSDKLGSSPAH